MSNYDLQKAYGALKQAQFKLNSVRAWCILDHSDGGLDDNMSRIIAACEGMIAFAELLQELLAKQIIGEVQTDGENVFIKNKGE